MVIFRSGFAPSAKIWSKHVPLASLIGQASKSMQLGHRAAKFAGRTGAAPSAD
jgi:hypothetical protein